MLHIQQYAKSQHVGFLIFICTMYLSRWDAPNRQKLVLVLKISNLTHTPSDPSSISWSPCIWDLLANDISCTQSQIANFTSCSRRSRWLRPSDSCTRSTGICCSCLNGPLAWVFSYHLGLLITLWHNFHMILTHLHNFGYFHPSQYALWHLFRHSWPILGPTQEGVTKIFRLPSPNGKHTRRSRGASKKFRVMGIEIRASWVHVLWDKLRNPREVLWIAKKRNNEKFNVPSDAQNVSTTRWTSVNWLSVWLQESPRASQHAKKRRAAKRGQTRDFSVSLEFNLVYPDTWQHVKTAGEDAIVQMESTGERESGREATM